jgi:hypothetical protein
MDSRLTRHVTANEVSPQPGSGEVRLPPGHPGPMCLRVTTTGGRSPGSPVAAFHRLPRHKCPVANGERLAAYSCGGSRGIGTLFEELALTAFPFDPPGGNRHHDVMLKPQKLSTASVLIAMPGSFGRVFDRSQFQRQTCHRRVNQLP